MSRILILFSSVFMYSTSALADEDLPNPVILTITFVETGDRGCYISGTENFKDGTRKERHLMGDFDCDKELLVDKTYELAWSLVNVLAMDCEGDVDCGRSDQEPVVHSFKEVVLTPKTSCWDNAATQIELNSCAYEEYKKSDEELNRVYTAIHTQYKSDKLFLKKLKRSQRAWIAFRDAEIEAFYPHQDKTRQHYGSIYPVCHNGLLTRLTIERIKQLQVWLDGVEEGSACRGTVKLKR